MDGTADASMDHLITGSDYAWLKSPDGELGVRVLWECEGRVGACRVFW